MAQSHQKQQAVDMTSGSIIRHLIVFTVPLLLGNLFQQLYNTVDSLVVGNFVGSEALAAVGSTTSIVNMLVLFFNGVSIGAGVVISRYFGSHNDAKLHVAVETTIAVTFICGIVLTGIGIYIAPFMLELMDTPEDVLPLSSEYLQIYFAGISGLLIYNMGSGILRSVGDTKRPLYFLCFSSLLNIVLDLWFVISFQMGVAGVAYATIISQFASAALVLLVLTKSTENYRLVWKDLSIDKGILKQILRIGLPSGLQQSLTAFSNAYVQSYINHFGSSCMAGWSCYTKIDQFVFLPMQSIGQAATTFVGQNLGAGDLKRAKKGTNVALGLATGISLVLAAILWLLAPQFVELFNRDEQVVVYGVLFLWLCLFFMVFCGPNQVISGALRGAGNAKIPMIVLLFSYVVFRQAYLFAATSIANVPSVVGFSYPAGWIVCSLILEIYYLSGRWEKHLDMN